MRPTPAIDKYIAPLFRTTGEKPLLFDSFKYALGDLLKEEWDSFIFVYDLGDAWKHRVTLIDIAPCKEGDAKRIPSTVSLRYFFRGFQNYHPYNEQISWSTANQWPAFFFVEGLAAAYRDRFPLKVREQGAGLEQTGAAGGPLVRGSSESVDGSDGHSLAGAWQ